MSKFKNIVRAISAGLLLLSNKFWVKLMCLGAIAFTIYVGEERKPKKKLI